MRYSHSSPEYLEDTVKMSYCLTLLPIIMGNIDENEEFNDWSSKYFH